MRVIIQCFVIFAIFTSTALASGWDGKLKPRMKVKEHIKEADAVLIGRFTGDYIRFIFDGYDENNQAKKRIFSAPFNLLEEKFGFPMADREIMVDEVLYLKDGLSINELITLRDVSNFEEQDSEKNKRYRAKMMSGKFLLFLRKTLDKEAYVLVSTRSLIKLGKSNSTLSYLKL